MQTPLSADFLEQLKAAARREKDDRDPPKPKAEKKASFRAKTVIDGSIGVTGGGVTKKSTSGKAGLRSNTPEAVAPITKRVKDVVEFLLKNVGKNMSAEQIKAGTRDYDLTTDAELQTALVKDGRVIVHEGYYQYKPQNPDIKDKESLLIFIRDKAPVRYGDISDSYAGVESDLELLKRAQRITVVGALEKKDQALFAMKDVRITVSEEARALYHKVHIPPDAARLQAEVAKHPHLRSALAHRNPTHLKLEDKPKQKKERKMRLNLDKATNKHLLGAGILENENVRSIDEK